MNYSEIINFSELTGADCFANEIVVETSEFLHEDSLNNSEFLKLADPLLISNPTAHDEEDVIESNLKEAETTHRNCATEGKSNLMQNEYISESGVKEVETTYRSKCIFNYGTEKENSTQKENIVFESNSKEIKTVDHVKCISKCASKGENSLMQIENIFESDTKDVETTNPVKCIFNYATEKENSTQKESIVFESNVKERKRTGDRVKCISNYTSKGENNFIQIENISESTIKRAKIAKHVKCLNYTTERENNLTQKENLFKSNVKEVEITNRANCISNSTNAGENNSTQDKEDIVFKSTVNDVETRDTVQSISNCITGGKNNSTANVKSKKLPRRTRTCPKNNRKYQGMKSFEVRHVLDTDCLKFCQENGVIAKSVLCTCGKSMALVPRKYDPKQANTNLVYLWTCKSTSLQNEHNSRMTFRKGTWFENSKISIKDILWLAYMWVYEYSMASIMHECNHSTETVQDRLAACQKVCRAIMEYKKEQLGGLNKIVELFPSEELKKEQWVFCALEQFSTKTVLINVPDKKSKTLLRIFDEYVLPDSTVLTNLWRIFKNFQESDFNYLKNQKSIIFYDDVSNTQIKNIKQLKKVAARSPAINASTKYTYNAKFCEQIYRKALSYSDDAFLTFLQDVSKIYTPIDRYTDKNLKRVPYWRQKSQNDAKQCLFQV